MNIYIYIYIYIERERINKRSRRRNKNNNYILYIYIYYIVILKSGIPCWCISISPIHFDTQTAARGKMRRTSSQCALEFSPQIGMSFGFAAPVAPSS